MPSPIRALLPTRRLPLALLVPVLLAASACGSGESGSSTSKQADVGSATADVTSAKADLAQHTAPFTSYPAIAPVSGGAAALKGKTVWYVPFGAAVPFLGAVGTSLTAAMGTVGATVKVCDGKFQPTEVANCMNQAAAQGAGAVVTGYVDYQLVPNAFDALVAKGIPVLAGGAAASGGKTASPRLAFYDSNATFEVSQRLLAESIIAASGGKANILYVGVADSPQLIQASTIGKKYLTDHCPACTVSSIDYQTAAQTKVASLVSAALISHPNTNYVLSQLDGAGADIASGIQTAGKTSSVALYSGGSGIDSLQRVLAGTQKALVGVGPAYQGWQFADGLVRMAAGGLPVLTASPVRVFTKDNAAGLDLTPAGQAGISWFGNDSYQQTFTRAWGVGG